VAAAPRQIIMAVASYYLGDVRTIEIAVATLLAGGHPWPRPWLRP
jgi:MoxR-like ATPase